LSADQGSRSIATPNSIDDEASPNDESTETSQTHRSSESHGDQFNWDVVTVELMHNYTIMTCFSISDEVVLQTFYQQVAPKLGFSHIHVLHLLLGLSALHLSRFRPSKRDFYVERAETHFQAGVRIASKLLSNVNQENCHSLFLFASLCSCFVIAQGPRPGKFLLFDDDGPGEWMSLFRGIQAVLETHLEEIKNGVLSPMIQSGMQEAQQSQHLLSSVESSQLTRLEILIQETAASPEESQTLNIALSDLRMLFASRLAGNGRKGCMQLRSFGGWVYRCSDEFTTLAQKRHPAALTMFAHVCVPLNDLSSNWIIAGWVPFLLTGIWERLPKQYHSWIQWPIQQTGWIPPEY
jgi:hypothetical protein